MHRALKMRATLFKASRRALFERPHAIRRPALPVWRIETNADWDVCNERHHTISAVMGCCLSVVAQAMLGGLCESLRSSLLRIPRFLTQARGCYAESADQLGRGYDRAAQLYRGSDAEALRQQRGAAPADQLPARPRGHHQGTVSFQAPAGRHAGMCLSLPCSTRRAFPFGSLRFQLLQQLLGASLSVTR